MIAHLRGEVLHIGTDRAILDVAGVGYLVLFGLGTMLSMATITLVLGVPFAIANGSRWVGQTVSSVAGAASVVFGAALMSDISLGTAFVPF